MPKRKVAELGGVGLPEESRRASRSKTSTEKPREAPSETGTKKISKRQKKTSTKVNGDDDAIVRAEQSKISGASTAAPAKQKSSASEPGRQYWLMKAEPESRMEKGHDIKFSIDDLEAKAQPEPWDGIRAFPARNNLRAMKKGDLAFFYHSSCKVPAIVGIMEIVKEHTPDLSAHDPSAPYYDPSSNPENPKWSLVHVKFRSKLSNPITLKDMRAFRAEKGNPLANMQMLKLTRLSVSKVGLGEWDFLTGVMEENGDQVVA